MYMFANINHNNKKEKRKFDMIYAWSHCITSLTGSFWVLVLPQFGYSLCKSLLFISTYVSVMFSFYLISYLQCPEPHSTPRDLLDRLH